MSRNRHLHSGLIMTVFTVVFSLFSAVCVLAASSVRITRPTNGSTVKPGKVAMWTSFDPPSSNSASVIASEYSPITYRIYKDNKFQFQQSVYQSQLSFTEEGSYSTSFTLSETGTYTIEASVPRTADERDFVTFDVSNGSDNYYSDDPNSWKFTDVLETKDLENISVISEGKPIRCVLTGSNRLMRIFKIRPSESGHYIFFAAGSPTRARIQFFEFENEHVSYDGDNYIDEYNPVKKEEERGRGSICLNPYLSEGTEYALLIQCADESVDSVFDVGYAKDNGTIIASTSEIILTDADNDYTLGLFKGERIRNCDYIISDTSVVESISVSEGNKGTYYGWYCVELKPKKNGTATLSIIDQYTKEVHASCKIICKGITEISDTSGKDNQSGSSGNGSASGGSASGGNASGGNASGNSTSGGTSGKSVASGPKTIKPVIKLSKTKFTWNNKVQTPKITVMDGKTVLSSSTYTVSLPKGRKNIGKYTIKVTMKGNYSGSGTATYKINPKGTSLSSVKAAKNSMTVQWKKQTVKMPKKQINGYQVQYSLKKNFKSGVKTVNVKGAKKVSAKISKLKTGKTYYVRVRTFMKVSGKNYYSGWSKVKKAKVK